MPNKNMVHAVAMEEIVKGELGCQCNSDPTLSFRMNMRRGIEPNTINETAVTNPFSMEVFYYNINNQVRGVIYT
jgi:hypothetical protein